MSYLVCLQLTCNEATRLRQRCSFPRTRLEHFDQHPRLSLSNPTCLRNPANTFQCNSNQRQLRIHVSKRLGEFVARRRIFRNAFADLHAKVGDLDDASGGGGEAIRCIKRGKLGIYVRRGCTVANEMGRRGIMALLPVSSRCAAQRE
jgi:hypothetical protein